MYFAARQYPKLAPLSPAERRRTVAESIRQGDPWIGRRLLLAFVIEVIGSGSIGLMPASWGIPSWGGTAFALVGGVFFYLYFLWELNGPLFLAVENHASRLR